LLVVGNDLRNEIRPDFKNKLYATWGDGNIKTDWKLAATNCGNQLLESLPHQLIIVEGLNYANTMSMIKESPIQLSAPNKLVYSFHMYSWQSVTSFNTYSAFVEGLTAEVGYILEQGQPWTAPLWLGEFGDNA
jgi:endoglucanase